MGGIVLIPAFNPGPEFVRLVERLCRDPGIERVITVNDGSSEAASSYFEAVQAQTKVICLEHAVNQGKGAALKTGLRHVLQSLPDTAGVVTADADGQHSVEDILNVVQALSRERDTLLLGVRSFDRRVPLRSRAGNTATRALFRLISNLDLADTQTGLRGISPTLISRLLEIPYDRYEFEMEMLFICVRDRVAIRQIAIETIYLDDNASSHFNPLLDSMRIYWVLLRYVAVSLITAAVDYVTFFVAYPLTDDSILATTYISRGVAVLANYLLLRNVVFHSSKMMLQTFPRYILLVAVSGLVASAMIHHFTTSFGVGVIPAKIVAELILYAVILLANKNFVFQAPYEKPE